MKEVYIVAAKRTPIGSFGGSLSQVPATRLGSIALKGAIDSIHLDPKLIDEVFLGNVCQANLGQAPARQAALGAGLSPNTPVTTINKVCASGMKSIALGAQSIQLGLNDIVAAGGFENMSQVPYYVTNARWGYKYGNGEFIDGLNKDGLMDSYDQIAMGVYADRTASKYNISRSEQDDFAIRSYKNAASATDEGKLKEEIVPVSVPQRKGDPIVIDRDEEYTKVNFDKIPALKGAFTPDGTVTAANASTMNDGASAVILMSKEKAEELGIKPLAKIISYADAELAPEWFTVAPVPAAQKALERAGMSIDQVDLIEVNEAFAVVPLTFAKETGASLDKINIYGGGCSLGHPLGSSGSKIIVTLINALHQTGAKYGLAGICNGGGGASSVVIERL